MRMVGRRVQVFSLKTSDRPTDRKTIRVPDEKKLAALLSSSLFTRFYLFCFLFLFLNRVANDNIQSNGQNKSK